MYYFDHNPPHFHVVYGEYEAVFMIDEIRLMKGNVPNRVERMVKEWGSLNIELLKENWNRCMIGEEIIKIDPLI
jgi:hypothetical protein